jgi:putative PIN family toxin of toxin-antitoxin system
VLKATADSNIYISALQFGGQPLRFLELARSGAIELAISPPIIAEVKRVLRTKFRWPDEQVNEIEPRLSVYTLRVEPTEALDAVKADPDDNRIIECARAAGSDYIVTGDLDLLRLGQYGDIKIVKVTDFLERGQFQSR